MVDNDKELNTSRAENESSTSKAVKEQTVVADYESYDEFSIYMDSDDDDLNEYKKGYKLYNFRRPDKFSKEHLRSLQDIHREFSRQLSLSMTGYLRLPINIDVVSVDQLTYDEFINSMPSPMTVCIFELSPLPGQILLGFSFEAISCIVDRMLGGIGSADTSARELTDIEEALTKKVTERTISTFANAWSNIMPAEAHLIAIENNYSLVQVASSGEIVALMTLEIQFGEKNYGLMNICMPYPLLENIIGQLSTQHIFQTKGIMATTEEKHNMINKLNLTNVDVEVIFGSTKISLQDFLDLKHGDVLKLDNKIQDDLIIKINGAKKFFGRPGIIKRKVSVKVTDRYDEVTDILKNYL